MKILIITVLLLLSTTTFGQGFAKIKVIDSVNRTDEIIIGNEGLIGVDSALGEVNLFNTPIDTLEIRTIQRPNMTCLFNYDQNIDLKIDQRPVCATLPMYSNFVIDVFANDYPVYVILTEEENFECCVTEYYLVDTMNCSYHPESGYDPFPGDTLFIFDGIKPN